MKGNLETGIAKLFSMTDEVWERHANPWSVWTRFSALPLLTMAFWSRAWLGPWAWLPTVLAILWIWLNPRIFRKPRSTDNWASKAVLGERVWLRRNETPIPPHHRLAPNLLSLLSGLGLPFLIWGLWHLRVWPTALGMVLIYAGKVWFLDRMVWLFEDMKDTSPEYASWLYRS